jgi:ATP-dependent DNA helicase RecQ
MKLFTSDADRDSLKKFASAYSGFCVYGPSFYQNSQLARTDVISLSAVLDKWTIRGLPTLTDPLLSTCVAEIPDVTPIDALKEAVQFFNFPPPQSFDQHLTWVPPSGPNSSPSYEEELFYEACRKRLPPLLFARLFPQASFRALGCEIGGADTRSVDFAIVLNAKHRCVIEIDGQQHSAAMQSLDDKNRDNELKKNDWHVFRVATSTVRANPDAVVERWISSLPSSAFSGAFKYGSGIHWNTTRNSFGFEHIYFPSCVQRALRALIYSVRKGALPSEGPWHLLMEGREQDVTFTALAILRRWWSCLYDLGWTDTPAPLVFVYSNSALNIRSKRISEESGLTLPVAPLTDSINVTAGIDFSGSLPPGSGCFESNGVPRIYIRASYNGVVHRKGLTTVRKFYPTLGELVASRGPDAEIRHREAAENALNLIFGYTKFRQGQYESVSRLIAGLDTISLLPTGGGKSIITHLSGMMLPGISLVVEPLISLIDDQVDNLRQRLCDANAGISSTLSEDEKRRIEHRMEGGELHSLFISPERLQIEEFRVLLRRLSIIFPITIAALDEAHCVSEWGHDFRPAYLHLIHNLRTHAFSLGSPPVIAALTGTASYSVLADIQAELSIKDEDALIVPESFNRREISYSVVDTRRRWRQYLTDIRDNLPEIFNTEADHFNSPENGFCGMVFCATIGKEDQKYFPTILNVAAHIQSKFVYCGQWPGRSICNLDDWGQQKKNTLVKFKRNQIREIVASKALGMGFDKPNVRYVIHVCLPESVESFYQESGRAGRDGGAARSFILIDRKSLENSSVWASDDPTVTLRSLSQQKGEWSTRAYFLNQGFPSRESETDQLVQFFTRYHTESEDAIVPFNLADKSTEKIIYRSVILGFLEDYSKDYRANAFRVVIARDLTPQKLIDNLKSYLQRCKFDDYVHSKCGDLDPSSLIETFTACAGIYLNYIYEEVLRRRLQSLQTMSDLCYEFASDEQFRSDMLNYFQNSKYTDMLRSWLGKSVREIGVDAILSLCRDCATMEELNLLLGTTRRMLDNDPTNVGFRVVIISAKLGLGDGRPVEKEVHQLLAVTASRIDPDLFPITLAAPVWDLLWLGAKDLAKEMADIWFQQSNPRALARSFIELYPSSDICGIAAIPSLLKHASLETANIIDRLAR